MGSTYKLVHSYPTNTHPSPIKLLFFSRSCTYPGYPDMKLFKDLTHSILILWIL